MAVQQGLGSIFDPLTELINSLKGTIAGAPQYDLGLAGDIGSTGIPSIGSNEDIQGVIDQFSQGLPPEVLDPSFSGGSELFQLQNAVRSAGQDFLSTGSDEDRIRFNAAVRQLQSGTNTIRAQVQGSSAGDFFLNDIQNLFNPGTDFGNALSTVERLRDTPTFSEQDILRLIGKARGESSASGNKELAAINSDLAKRGIGSSGVAADIVSNARTSLRTGLDELSADVAEKAAIQNKTDSAVFANEVAKLLDLKTKTLAGAEQVKTSLKSNNPIGIGISSSDYFDQLGSALSQVDFFNSQIGSNKFDQSVDSFISNVLALDASRKAGKNQNADSSSSPFSFGLGYGADGPTVNTGFQF